MLALVLAMALCLCVCLSVTSWSSIETAELIGNLGTFKNKGSFLWNFAPNSRLRKFRHDRSITRLQRYDDSTDFFSKWRPSAILKITKIIFNFYSWLIFSSSVVFCGDLGWNTGWAVKEFSCKGLFIAHKLNWTGVRGLEFVRCEHVFKTGVQLSSYLWTRRKRSTNILFVAALPPLKDVQAQDDLTYEVCSQRNVYSRVKCLILLVTAKD